MKKPEVSTNRFATKNEVFSREFRKIWRVLAKIHRNYELPDHGDVNKRRYLWAKNLLRYPEIYAARLWEYPYAILSANLRPGMKCLDVGCGMTAFTIYLSEVSKTKITGLDPDIFDSGVKYKGHGVSKEFIKRTGLKIVEGGTENLPFKSNSFERVFCISVIEHLPKKILEAGLKEIARVLKPSGLAVLTFDINMLSEINRPLDIIWESGLIPMGSIDLKWPFHRFGIFSDGIQPADVFGLTLLKDNYTVSRDYKGKRIIQAYLIPTMRDKWMSSHVISYRFKRLVRDILKL